MTGYLSKPFLPEDVMGTIDAYLTSSPEETSGSRSDTAGAESPAVTWSGDHATTCPFDFDSLLKHCMGNRDFLSKMVVKFPETAWQGDGTTGAERGPGECPAGGAAGPWPEGAAANLSAEALRAAAARLEPWAEPGGYGRSPLRLAELQHEARQFIAYAANQCRMGTRYFRFQARTGRGDDRGRRG